MKKVITIIGLFGLIFVQAQVGINNDTPNATLDIAAEKTDGTQVEGLLLPRISKEAAYNMAIATTKPQESNMVYVNNANYTFPAGVTDAQKTTVADITEKGYYFWNGSKWVKTAGESGVEWKDGSITTGSTTTNYIYANQAKNAGNDVVISDNGRIGIAIQSPESPLQIYSEGALVGNAINTGLAGKDFKKIHTLNNGQSAFYGNYFWNSIDKDYSAQNHIGFQTASLLSEDRTTNFEMLAATYIEAANLSSAPVVTLLRGLSLSAAHGGSGVVNNIVGSHVNVSLRGVDPNNPNKNLKGGSVKKMYGFYISGVKGALDNNYAIYTNEGKVRFGDDVGIGIGVNKNPLAKLNVIAGATADTKNIHKATISSITTSEVLNSYVHTIDGSISSNMFRTFAGDAQANKTVTGLNTATVYEGAVDNPGSISGAYVHARNSSETGNLHALRGLTVSSLHAGKLNVAHNVGISIHLANSNLTQPGSTITNQAGLRIESISGATNSNHAILTHAGKVSLGDVLVLRHRGDAPTSSNDASGENGEIRYDGNFIYIKVSGQWKRSALSSF